MKKAFLTLCVILALLLSVGSFTLAFTQIVKDDAPEDVEESVSETEPAPVIKTFTFYAWGSGMGVSEYQEKYPCTFSYEEGMTWAEFCDSEYGIGFTYDLDSNSVVNSHTTQPVVSFTETIESPESPSSYEAVSPNDVIEFDQYGSDT